MKRNIALVTSVGVAMGLLGGCGGGDHGPPVSGSTTPTQQKLDTQNVLTQAQMTSETSFPYAIDDELVVLTDTSDTSAPISIDANGT